MKRLSRFSFNLLFYFGLMSLAPSAIAQMGGLTYGLVNWPANPSYYNIDQSLRIDTAPPTNSGQGYFWSNQFSLGQAVGYFGLQQLPDGRRIVNAAIWNTKAGYAANGFTAAPFAGEGTGIRIYGSYPWMPGRIYTLRIWIISSDWWGFWIVDTVTGVSTYVGQIQNQDAPGHYLTGSLTFTEQFIGPNTCSGVAPVRSTWFLPVANNHTVIATSVSGVVNNSSAVSACGKQVVSVTKKINNVPVNQQVVFGRAADSGLDATP